MSDADMTEELTWPEKDDLVRRKAVLELERDICVTLEGGQEYRHRSIDPCAVFELPRAKRDPKEDMEVLVTRQAVKEWLRRWSGYIDEDILARMEMRIMDIRPAGRLAANEVTIKAPEMTDEQLKEIAAEIAKGRTTLERLPIERRTVPYLCPNCGSPIAFVLGGDPENGLSYRCPKCGAQE